MSNKKIALLPGLRNWFDTKKRCEQDFSLLNIDLQLTNKCNFNCIYCSANSGKNAQNELNINEIKNFIDTCKAMNVKSITLTGGEPLLKKNFLEIIYYLRQNNFEINMFTNGSLITEELAIILYENKVALCLKLDTLNKDTYNFLTGTDDVFDSVFNKIQLLKEVGYTYDLPLSINSVITSKNIKDIPNLWKWARKNNVVPNCERLVTKGRAENSLLAVNKKLLKDIFEELCSIDNNFGIHWKSKIPFCGFIGCIKHNISLYLTCTGSITLCPGVDIPFGNIRNENFIDILTTIKSEKEYFRSKMTGECSICENKNICYGCRGLAYNITGNYLDSDPLCWFDQDD